MVQQYRPLGRVAVLLDPKLCTLGSKMIMASTPISTFAHKSVFVHASPIEGKQIDVDIGYVPLCPANHHRKAVRGIPSSSS
jgi:hypothetical protein